MSSGNAVASRPAPTPANLVVIPESEHDELTLVRNTYAKDLTNDEFGVLVADARHRGLSVVKREVVGIKFAGKMTPFVTLVGVRKLAEESGKYAGSEGPYFCGPDGKWVEVWLANGPPAAAKFIVHRVDSRFPVVGIATWKERAQLMSPTWKSMPSVMLGKVAEMDAIRRARLIADDVPVYVGDEGDGIVPEPKIGAMRHLHGVGRDRGLDHGELRTVVRAIRPGIASMTDEAVGARDLGAAADLIDALDDNAVDEIVTDPERMAMPAEYVVAPEEESQEAVVIEVDDKVITTWLGNIDRAKTIRSLDGIATVLDNAGLTEQPRINNALTSKRAELETA